MRSAVQIDWVPDTHVVLPSLFHITDYPVFPGLTGFRDGSAGAGEEESTTDGRLIVDRGVLLFQRTFVSQFNPNVLSTRLFSRDRKDDSIQTINLRM